MDRLSRFLVVRPSRPVYALVSGCNPRLSGVGWEIALRADNQTEGQASEQMESSAPRGSH